MTREKPGDPAAGTGAHAVGHEPDGTRPWQDPTRPDDERVAELLSRMTLEEKVAQLYGVWVGVDPSGDGVAPHQHDLSDPDLDWPELISTGLGQLTRPFGTAPVDPAVGARALARTQAEIAAANRFGIPALAHEECLSGFTTWRATIYPTPLAWGATFDPELVERMARQIGSALRAVGVHQGLAPVLDVTRDPRWGRTEETIGEDPYLVGTVGSAYVRGLESAGIVATLKHFVGYSASRAGRNLAPVAAGPRELADVLLPPFELAVRDGGARSVMHSYSEIDGVPTVADGDLLTGLLRDTWGFDGTVVADYFGISFLQLLHGVAGSTAEAAGLALAAGVDVELPTARCYREPLLAAVRAGDVAEDLIDRAAERVLRQKCELGLLDRGWRPESSALDGIEGPLAGNGRGSGADPVNPGNSTDSDSSSTDTGSDSGSRSDSGSDSGSSSDSGDSIEGSVDLDPPEARAIARRLAEESVVLLANDGTLPLRAGTRLAVVGPLAADPMAVLGCYSFPRHVLSNHPELPLGVEIATLLQALGDELPGQAEVPFAPGCSVDGTDRSGIGAAVEAARAAEVCVAFLGDRAGLFGRGTSGEGCDAEDLRLPGVQEELLESLLQTGTPVVAVLVTGRPYALGAFAGRLAAAVQTFFPGEEGPSAVAGVLSGRLCPSGRLPVSVPRGPGGQPATYLVPRLGGPTKVSNLDPTPLFAFGHGLSYTTFEWDTVRVGDGDPTAPADVERDRPVEVDTDGTVWLSLVVRNSGDRAGAEVVQLYLHDPVAQTTRPVVRLVGYARAELQPGQSGRIRFGVHADLAAYTGRDGRRLVEPGDLELRLAASSVDVRQVVPVRLSGPTRFVDHRRHLVADVSVTAGATW